MTPTTLWWSSGKDSAWALHKLNQSKTHRVTGLITTVNAAAERVAMHGVRRSLLEAQAVAAGLPLTVVELPFPCSNADYEAAVKPVIEAAVRDGTRAMAFGDLFLEDIRAYRSNLLKDFPLEAVFPLWGEDTAALAQEMHASGLRARVTCLDPKRVPRTLAGADFKPSFFDALPPEVDWCGENGEFHTFTYEGPMFSQPVPVIVGETVERDGFVFTDLMAA